MKRRGRINLPLTTREADLYGFIRDRVHNDAIVPSIREMMTKLGVLSSNWIATLLRSLEYKGRIRRPRGKSRNINVLFPVGTIPLLMIT